MIPIDFDGVRRRHRLADVARRTGLSVDADVRDLVVCCPIPTHDDSTPSMVLHLSTDRYHCFGCEARGDVIQWIRDICGVRVAEAVRMLDADGPLAQPPAGAIINRHTAAGRHSANSTGTERPDLQRTSPQRVTAVLGAAWDYYACKPLHHRGVDYLAERGINVGVLEVHRAELHVGHTPTRSDGLVTALGRQGFTDDELVDAGLAQRRLDGGPLRDFYRQRVLIPIRNHHGQVCGLIGRNVGDCRYPKYKNPPRTAIYDKSIDLYQPLPAPGHPDGRVIVVEGTLDAMAIAVAAIRTGQADRFCPVTQSGKELSATQLTIVFGLHPNPPLTSFDGDAAGRESNERVARAAAHRGAAVTIVSLPDGHDPASWLVERGSEGLRVWTPDRSDNAPARIRRASPPSAHGVPLVQSPDLVNVPSL